MPSRSCSLLIIAFFLLAVSEGFGQGSSVRLSLEDALNRIGEQNEEIRIALAGIHRAEGNEKVAKSGFLPQVSASATYTRTLKSQYSGISTPTQQTNKDTSGQSGGNLSSLLSNLPFGRENVWSLGLNASQNIYTGGRLTAQASAAENRLESSRIDLTSQQAELILNVAQSYYDALLADQLVDIAEASLKQSQKTYEDIQLAYKVGERPEFEALRARVTRDNQVPVLVDRQNQRELAHLRLKQLLNIPMQDTLILTGSVRDSSARFAALADSSAEVRAPVRQSILNVEASRSQVDIAQSEGLPQINISTRLAPTAYEALPSPNDFRTDWTVSLNASMPLFTGGRISGSVDAAEAGVEEAEARLAQAREAASLDAKSTYNEYEQAIAALRAAEGAGDLARRAYSIAQLRYKEGISTLLELSDARLQQDQALSNEARAYRNYHVAKAKLALLKDLPLGGSTAGFGGVSATATQALQTQTATATSQTTSTSVTGAGATSTFTQPGSIPGQ